MLNMIKNGFVPNVSDQKYVCSMDRAGCVSTVYNVYV